ncbi:MAG: M48 family metallopeptidase [Acidobacteria bacterium]|nr:M48 family metallopeptidase [Acidobacteriota bacterium]
MTSDPIFMNEDKATRYHRLRRHAAFAGTALGALFLIALLVTGWSADLRDAAASAARSSFTLTVVLYVVLIALLSEAVQLPLAFYQGVTLERRYGLSTQPTARWWLDRLKAGAVGLLFAVGGALIVWWLLRWSPERWWLVAALCFGLVLVLLAQVAPVLLLPVFYRFKPLDRPALVSRLVSLAERAGATVVGVFEWQLSDRTRKANAALTGIGRTRRILLSDTLLAEHSDDEIEVVLAHEFAHHVHHDIWKGIALEGVLLVLGFYLADRVLERSVGRFGLTAKDDIAGMPLLLLAGGAVSLVLLPVANAVSRRHERRADRYALDMTRNAAAFISAMRRLAAQNLAEERPSRWVEILFHSHPSTSARVEFARAWESAARS